jgi:hypothetical protein
MDFPLEKLTPRGGEITVVINPEGERHLWWQVGVDFENIGYPDKNLGEVGFQIELVHDVRCWQELKVDHLKLLRDDPKAQLWFNFINWDHPVREAVLSIERRVENIFTIEVEMVVDFYGWSEVDRNPYMPISAKINLPFLHLWLVYNLGAKAIDEAKAIASEFVDLTCFEEPSMRTMQILDRDCADFLFRPRL